MTTPQENAYIQLFEELSAERLLDLNRIVSPEIRFKDPFNDITGINGFRKILEHTLRDVENPTFNVTHRAWADDVLFVRWSFSGRVRRLGLWRIDGMSEIRFDTAGRVREHIDYWDAAEHFYARLPVVGWLIRRIEVLLRVS